MKKVVEKRKDIVFLLKMFPLAMHKGAYDKAKSIACEKSLELLNKALKNEEIPPAKCNSTVVDENIALAGKLGIQGAPTIVFPDGRVVPGYMPADELITEEDKKRKQLKNDGQ